MTLKTLMKNFLRKNQCSRQKPRKRNAVQCNKILTFRLKVEDLKMPYLISIFLRENSTFVDDMDLIKSRKQRKDYEHDLILAFWFAVDQKNVEMIKHIMCQDQYIRQLVALAMHNKIDPSSSNPDNIFDQQAVMVNQAKKEFLKTMKNQTN